MADPRDVARRAWRLIENQRRLVGARAQGVDRAEDSRLADEARLQAALAGEVEQHDLEQDREHALARQRHDDAGDDQHHARQVLRHDARRAQDRVVLGQELARVRRVEVVRRQPLTRTNVTAAMLPTKVKTESATPKRTRPTKSTRIRESSAPASQAWKQ